MSASHKIATGPFPPGSTYVAPPKTDAVNPFTIGDESFCPSSQGRVKPKNLQKCFQGLGRDTAQELAKRLKTDEKLKPSVPFSKLQLSLA